MKRRFLAIVFTLFAVFVLVAPALAQSSYLFSVPQETVDVYWNADGTTSLDYHFTFTNNPSGHVIDFVDVGMPNGNFSITSPMATAAPAPGSGPAPTIPLSGTINGAFADVGGKRVNLSSDYQGKGSYGFSVDMGAYAIQPGQTGTVHVYVGGITGVLYPDSKDSNYASAVFSPTWFGSQFVEGNTDMTVTFHLPPGVQTTEPRWHASPSGFPSEPQAALDNEGRVTYTWTANVSATQAYDFGASFPKSYIPDTAIVTTNIFDVIFGGITAVIGFMSNSLPCLCFAIIFFGIPIFSAFNTNRRKMQYLPPKVSIEGHGIKRGLTAVEAAILMEQPLDKVMTMILFAVVKKSAAQVVKRDPLELSFAKEPPADLHQYEKDFLQAFAEPDATKRRRLLQDMTVALVRSVSDKMKGFSRKETSDYYKSIMEQAWKQVEAANTPEVKSQKLEENLEWTMLDKDYDDHSRRVYTGPVYVPTWWGRYDPTYRPTPAATSARPVSAPSVSGGNRPLPGADFAASVVGGVQTFSSKVIGNVNSFTEKVTGVTNPPPPPSTSSSRSGGGGGGHSSCACACACAGCACACAGGGR